MHLLRVAVIDNLELTVVLATVNSWLIHTWHRRRPWLPWLQWVDACVYHATKLVRGWFLWLWSWIKGSCYGYHRGWRVGLWVAAGWSFSLQKSHSKDSHSDLCALGQKTHKHTHCALTASNTQYVAGVLCELQVLLEVTAFDSPSQKFTASGNFPKKRGTSSEKFVFQMLNRNSECLTMTTNKIHLLVGNISGCKKKKKEKNELIKI